MFAGLPRPGLERLSMAAVEVMIPRHEYSFRAGDAPGAIYVLRRGLICISVPMGHARNVILALLGPGRAFGWGSLLGDSIRPISAMALADSLAWMIPADAVREVADSDVEAGAALYRNFRRCCIGP
jgi:CRP-like cAMP-binding protein